MQKVREKLLEFPLGAEPLVLDWVDQSWLKGGETRHEGYEFCDRQDYVCWLQSGDYLLGGGEGFPGESMGTGTGGRLGVSKDPESWPEACVSSS